MDVVAVVMMVVTMILTFPPPMWWWWWWHLDSDDEDCGRMVFSTHQPGWIIGRSFVAVSPVRFFLEIAGVRCAIDDTCDRAGVLLNDA